MTDSERGRIWLALALGELALAKLDHGWFAWFWGVMAVLSLASAGWYWFVKPAWTAVSRRREARVRH